MINFAADHKAMLSQEGIEVSSLPQEIQDAIKAYDDTVADTTLEDTPENQQKVADLDDNICELLYDHFDEEEEQAEQTDEHTKPEPEQPAQTEKTAAQEIDTSTYPSAVHPAPPVEVPKKEEGGILDYLGF